MGGGSDRSQNQAESELAVIAVARTLFDLLIQNRVFTAEAVDRLLGIQQRGFEKQQVWIAAEMLATVRTHLAKSHEANDDRN